MSSCIDTRGMGTQTKDSEISSLVRTLEGEIIPRLMLLHREEPPVNGERLLPTATRAVTRADVAAFCESVLSASPQECESSCQRLQGEGVTVEQLYLDLFAPVARQLGEMWVNDERNFAEVTVGLCRLHGLLRDLAPRFRGQEQPSGHGRRALILPAPGEQHMFGAVMVSEFFRRAGWDVRSGPAESEDALAALVRRQSFALLGLSASTQQGLDVLPKLIERLRDCSRNPDLLVYVGGTVFHGHPERVEEVGADGTGEDASEAALRADSLVAILA